MDNKIKENTFVSRISPTGTHCTARVRWVNEKGEAGITYITPDSYAGTAQVVDVDELTALQNDIIEDLKDVPKEDLIAAITRLRGARLPKKLAARRPSTRKKSVKSKLSLVLAEGGDALDALLIRAAKEKREEEEIK